MGLSFLNKKSWHPTTVSNVQLVWQAEQKNKQRKKIEQQRIKRIKQDRQLEALKKAQAQVGLIPQSNAIRLEWLYQGPTNANKNSSSSEQYLLGKASKEEGEQQSKQDFIPVVKESTVNQENENFSKLIQDPMVKIKQKEMMARNQLMNNPFKLRKMRDDLINQMCNKEEAQLIKKFMGAKEKKKQEKQKRKKERKEQKMKQKVLRARGLQDNKHERNRSEQSKSQSHNRRNSYSRQNFEDQTTDQQSVRQYRRKKHYYSRSRSNSQENEQRRLPCHQRYCSRSISTQRQANSEQNRRKYYGLDSKGKRDSSNKDYRPDQKLYGSKMRQQEELRRLKQRDPQRNFKKLSREEAQEQQYQMRARAEMLRSKTHKKYLNYSQNNRQHQASKGKFKFMQNAHSSAYYQGVSVADRIQRNQHYRERIVRDD